MTTDEYDRIRRLRGRVSDAIAARADISSLSLAVLAAYQRLDGLSGQASLLKRSWPRSITELLDQQIREPASEWRQRKSISRITPIADGTSVTVQKQYEDNPYPRWIRLPAVAAPPIPVDESFRRNFPFSNYRSIGKLSGLDVLIAGCGTGRHSILFAQSFLGVSLFRSRT